MDEPRPTPAQIRLLRKLGYEREPRTKREATEILAALLKRKGDRDGRS